MVQASLFKPAGKAGEIADESFSEHVQELITDKVGPQLPCYGASKILGDFLARFGFQDAMAIVNQALGVHGGMWRSAPVTVYRFQQQHDGFFAHPLLEEARAAQ